MLNLKYFGMTGVGKTIKEAKLDAGARIEKALEGDYEPIILAADGTVFVCWRSPSGWHYGRVSTDQQYLVGSSMYHSRKDCEFAARHHLGMHATNWKTCFSQADVDPIVESIPARIEIANNCKWQRDMRFLMDAGLSDNDARNLIGGFPTSQPIPESLKDWKPESRK